MECVGCFCFMSDLHMCSIVAYDHKINIRTGKLTASCVKHCTMSMARLSGNNCACTHSLMFENNGLKCYQGALHGGL